MPKVGSNTVPERLVAFRVYNEANDLLGIATVTMPEITFMSDEVSGAGIAGQVDSPVLGHLQAMQTTLSWRTIEKAAAVLMEQKAHHLEFRGALQDYNASDGTIETRAVRLVMRAMPKKFGLGNLEPGSSTDSESEFEVVYLKLFIEDREVLEIDKYNYIYKVNGKDLLAPVRKALGQSW